MDLKKIRKRINEIDEELVRLLEDRLHVVKDVAAYKAQTGKPVRDQDREDQVVKSVVSRLEDEQLSPYMERIFRQLMMVSSRMQYDLIGSGLTTGKSVHEEELLSSVKVGYLGMPGSFSEQAVVSYYGGDVDAKGYPTFDAVCDALKEGQVKRAILPMENSSTGSVNRVVDLIRERDVYMVGEEMVMVRHYLLGVPGAALRDIKEVHSHPQPLEQCGEFLRAGSFVIQPSQSTAAAAQMISKRKEKEAAAIGSKRAAKIYGLDILAGDIQDNNRNYTRFAVLSNESIIEKDADKVSLVFAVANQPGALYHALRAFADRNINLIKLESRPIWSQTWHYFFHLDLTGRLDDPRVMDAIEEISSLCEMVKVLGNYKACTLKDSKA